jgi:3-hydroxybutyrate dehydrogenase
LEKQVDSLHEKVAVVTGAASGIGRAIAENLAAGGARVIIADLQRDAGETVAAEVGGYFVETNLARAVDCQNLIQRTVEQFGTVHILVNNAGFQHIDAIDEFPEDVWDKMIAVMLTGPFRLTKACWPHMRRQQWGRIINIASVAAVRGHPFKAGYISVKHGLLGLTRATALEGGPHGITVHAVCPTWVSTPLVLNQIADQARTRGLKEEEVVEKVMAGSTAIGRLLAPKEVADLVRFLCSDAAAGMTGSPVMIDGGVVAG